MTTAAKSTVPAKTPAAKREPANLVTRIKNQLNVAALRGKLTVDELSDLQQHITKVSGLIS